MSAPLSKPLQAEPQAVKHTIRWVLAHEPVSVFEKAAKRFSEMMPELTGGDVAVRVMTTTEFGGGKPTPPPLIGWNLASGRLEMCQTYTPIFGQFSPMLWSVDLPFLFRDHAHARRVLDGEQGQKMLESLLPYNIRGLAFTYSGGYRMIATTGAQIERWEDLKGLRVRTSHSPVAVDVLQTVGAIPVPCPSLDAAPLAEAGSIDAAEGTYVRYTALGQDKTFRTICDTRHSLFLTVLAVNERFYQSLPEAHRRTLTASARSIAEMEREQSIADGEKARTAAMASGVKVVTMSEAERIRFAERTRGSYERFSSLFGAGFIDSIVKA